MSLIFPQSLKDKQLPQKDNLIYLEEQIQNLLQGVEVLQGVY